MGWVFWMGCGWFFFGTLVGGDGDGEEKTPGYVHQGRFRWTTHVVKQSPFLCYMLYIEHWGFRSFMFQDYRERCRRTSMPWVHT